MPEVSKTTQHTTTSFIASILELTPCLHRIWEGNIANLRGFYIWTLAVSMAFAYFLFKIQRGDYLNATPKSASQQKRLGQRRLSHSSYRYAVIAQDLMTGHSRIRSHHVRPKHLSSPDTWCSDFIFLKWSWRRTWIDWDLSSLYKTSDIKSQEIRGGVKQGTHVHEAFRNKITPTRHGLKLYLQKTRRKMEKWRIEWFVDLIAFLFSLFPLSRWFGNVWYVGYSKTHDGSALASCHATSRAFMEVWDIIGDVYQKLSSAQR